LRGAGSLLGGEQSGHIEAIGFELYTQMLDRAVREMKGEAAPDEAETQLNLGLNIRIPVNYIPEENQRLRMYKRVAGVETESQLSDVGAELEDRYGEPPAAVRNLLDYASLKLLSVPVGVTATGRAIYSRRDAEILSESHGSRGSSRPSRNSAGKTGRRASPAGPRIGESPVASPKASAYFTSFHQAG